jgi:gliding motility-associated lipoprotein GldH
MRLLILILTVFILSSCKKDNLLFSASYKFSNNGWGKNETIRFETDIKDSESTFRVNITLIHGEAYLYSNLLFSLVIITPDGAERSTDFEIFLKDDNRNFTGKSTDEGIVFIFDGLKKTSFFTPGKYTFILNHHMPFASVSELKELRFAIFKLSE